MKLLQLFEGTGLGNEFSLHTISLRELKEGDFFHDNRGRKWVLKVIDGDKYSWQFKNQVPMLIGQGDPDTSVLDSLPRKAPPKKKGMGVVKDFLAGRAS